MDTIDKNKNRKYSNTIKLSKEKKSTKRSRPKHQHQPLDEEQNVIDNERQEQQLRMNDKKKKKKTKTTNDEQRKMQFKKSAITDSSHGTISTVSSSVQRPSHSPNKNHKNTNVAMPAATPYRYILAPMVGASELAFRLLCRKYGTQLAYTPMMSAERFAYDPDYRIKEHLLFPIQTTTTTTETNSSYDGNNNNNYSKMTKQLKDADRHLVIHVSANTPQHFADAAMVAYEQYNAYAIDLNLGCPQRTAYIGHYGSYLLDRKDRTLICTMIQTAVQKVQNKLPIFCKIRLLDTIDETIELVKQIRDAGATLIAIHARYRASWERTSASARDGPALLEQITIIQQAVPNILIVSNGNTITWEDVCTNLQNTNANGIMSAEGILDNPALFLPQYGTRTEQQKQILVWDLVKKTKTTTTNDEIGTKQSKIENDLSLKLQAVDERKQKLVKKINKIQKIEQKSLNNNGIHSSLTDKEQLKLKSKEKIQKKLIKIEKKAAKILSSIRQMKQQPTLRTPTTIVDDSSINCCYEYEMKQVSIPLGTLYDAANDKLVLAYEYLQFATIFPPTIRTIVFHIRRMLKKELEQYQLLQDCINCTTIHQIKTTILDQIQLYRNNPTLFQYNQIKAQHEKDELERKKREEGKRKDYEARMIRKAKREKRTDIMYYLQLGAQVPTIQEIQQLKQMLLIDDDGSKNNITTNNNNKQQRKDEVLQRWKENHSQHCLAYHIEPNGCPRGRTCAFLHVDAGTSSTNNNDESEQISG